ncbi:uncharacterized protein I206_100099 [Kwoniella pini CBS 10737]|uniref:Uncharacterized protein n=1 Tax=Kwoniella pini CBS 10737 TaxID=1296096 RepID=A0AAJ8KYT7_9TREE
MSDPFDEDDGFFDNPETLGLLDAVEEKAIQASQQAPPKNRFTQPIRHVLAKPRNSPTSSIASSSTNKLKKEPRPVNTEPGIRGTGFGWEIGGKRSFDVERHIDNAKQREAYWNAGRDEEDESPPVDVVMDGSGRYELSTQVRNNNNNAVNGRMESKNGVNTEEAVITDNRRAQPSILGESLGLAGPGPTGSQNQRMIRQQSQDAIAARRRAMQAAASTVGNEAQSFRRPLLSRSNSSSSTGSSSLPHHDINRQSNAPAQNRFANQVPPKESKFHNNRSLSRSVSAGAQIFNRNAHGNAIAGPSRLPTIPSESQSHTGSNEANGSISEGRDTSAPPLSQGSAARAAAIELEIERRKRQELEAELAALRSQAQVESSKSGRINIDANEGDEDYRKKVKELQSQVWAAKGEAEIVRRAQREEHQRHLAELERLKLTIENKEQQLKDRGEQAKRQVENIKHQAVFSNHAAHNSASKVRQQSQRFPPSQSQYRGFPTPVKNGSPSRRRGVADEMFTPLIQSAKGKGKAPISGPNFGGFNNAFAASPSVGPRTKRQKTADKSSPPASPNRAVSPSPFNNSLEPARSQTTPGSIGGQDEDIDWGDHILPLNQDAIPDQNDQVMDEVKDHRAELLYHLFHHVTLSIFQYDLGSSTEPTLYRLMNYRPSITSEGHEIYTSRCSEILKACGDTELTFDELEAIIVDSLCDMMDYIVKIVLNIERVSLDEIAVYCNIICLLSSSLLLFPSLLRVLVNNNTTENLRSTIHILYADSPRIAAFKDRMRVKQAVDEHCDREETTNEKSKKEPRETDTWYIELADRIAELAGIICHVSETSSWKADELVDIILGLTSIHQEPFVVQRGIELFYVASQQACNFRSLVMSSDKYKLPSSPNESPVVERLSRYLINPLATASEAEALHMSNLALTGLCMLSISHSDAVIIMAAKSILVPALIIVVQRESTKLYGIYGVLQDYKAALSLLIPALSLLHQLVFPAPISIPNQSQSQQQHGEIIESIPEDELPAGIDLPERVNHAASTREFNGLQHLFVSAFGVMAYSQIDEEIVEEVEQRSIQYLSGDLLENVVEGPEGDAIYELYVPLEEEDEESVLQQNGKDDLEENEEIGRMEIDHQNNEQVDMEVYKEMGRDFSEIIEIDDDDDDDDGD